MVKVLDFFLLMTTFVILLKFWLIEYQVCHNSAISRLYLVVILIWHYLQYTQKSLKQKTKKCVFAFKVPPLETASGKYPNK